MRARIQKISKYAPSIFQGRLNFSSGRRGFTLTLEHPAERITFWLLLGALGVIAALYLYLVGISILNVIARKNALEESVGISSAVSQLERDYFAATQGIGPEDGTRIGLSPVANTVYIHRPGNTAVAPLSRDEI
ncbi:hypothetical protein A3A39_04065 [Candidatus Kaiserbacteria bacterium RIFCSPLOWO2_01_FULL_54_13]|uniref:Uncharacterized protein n=1 Tax=Candidatus Kaiserbacteria bacterium RIFCSPLOWO2_01_FULL_54_13 TaxID=1798512 RepID=A0A1F6F438_9BACT|nr:MAG: hypothetical protein A3A39_04065 [Candidatus Kaiserbacteria bacterium RIFCSPLOWO2_01_FULL_54_13]